MPDEWDQYRTKPAQPADEWDQYRTKPAQPADEWDQYRATPAFSPVATDGKPIYTGTAPVGNRTSNPTFFDKIVTGGTGDILSPPKSRGDNPVKRLMEGIGSSLGRTTQAWSDALSFNPNERTAAEMIPLLGPAAVDAVETISNPKTRMEGVGAVGSILLPAMVHGGVPKPDIAGMKSAVASRLFKVDPHDAAFRAIKPAATRLDFDKHLRVAMPDIRAAAPKPIQGVADALEAVKAAKQANRAAYDKYRGPANQRGTVVDMSPVADAMDASIPQTLLFEAERGVQSAQQQVAGMRARNKAYRTQVSMAKAELFLQEANAELDAFYAKYPRQQWRALATNPESASTFSKAQAARAAIYKTLESETEGAGPRAIQSRYGSLLEVEQQLQRRKNVADRQQPQSLAQQAGKASAFGKVALGVGKALNKDFMGAVGSAVEGLAIKSASDWIKEQQTSNALLKRAFADYKNPQSPFPVPAPVQIPELLEAPPRPMPRGRPMPGGLQLALPPSHNVSGIGGGIVVPDFINKDVFAPRQIEAGQFDRGLPSGPGPFRQPGTLPSDLPEGRLFPLSTSPEPINRPGTSGPSTPSRPTAAEDADFIKKFLIPEKKVRKGAKTSLLDSDPLGLFAIQESRRV